MSATAQPGAAAPGAYYAPAEWGGPPRSGFDPWSLVWSLPKPVLIAATVLAFVLFWPIGLAVLCFMVGTGRIGGRWAHRNGGKHAADRGGGCGRRRDEAPSSGNRAFDEYRQETLRRLEEEQRDFAAFLERLRFAKDKAEFDQFVADRRQRPPAPPAQDHPEPQG